MSHWAAPYCLALEIARMKLEAGKRYVTKSGWITPPMETDASSLGTTEFFCGTEDLKCGIGVHSWDFEGRYFSQMNDDADIVAEYGVTETPETEVTDEDVLTVMQSLGGSFASGLASLYRKADSVNRVKLKSTFCDYWAEYIQHARIIKNRGS